MGISNPDARQNFGFQAFHILGLKVRLVVETDEVEEPVKHQMLKMVDRKRAALVCLTAHGLGRQDHVAEDAGGFYSGRCLEGKGQDVGGLVLPAVRPVELLDEGIVGQDDGGLGTANGSGPGMAASRPPQSGRSGIIVREARLPDFRRWTEWNAYCRLGRS